MLHFESKIVFKILSLPYQMHNHFIYFCNVASVAYSLCESMFPAIWINASWYQNDVYKVVRMFVYMYSYMLSSLCFEIFRSNRVMFRNIKLRSKYSFVAWMKYAKYRILLNNPIITMHVLISIAEDAIDSPNLQL